jgi:uncharacterized protein (TIGR02996 family)
MGVEDTLLGAIPHDPLAAFALADYLEERGDPRGELIRLAYTLTRAVEIPGRPEKEERLRALLAAGVRPVGPYEMVTLAPGVEMGFAWVPPGTFVMGSPPREKGRQENETRHRVTLTRGYYLGVHAVTQAQWRAVLGTDPSHFKGDDLPVEQVGWAEARAYAAQLTEQRGDGHVYRLPTEAEWEYACRAGTDTPFHFGATLSTDQANFDGRRRGRGVHRDETTPVGSFPANAWGLYDMHGNVYEWCADYYEKYPRGEVTDPTGPTEGWCWVIRGGGWNTGAGFCRAALRYALAGTVGRDYVGFRVARSLPPGGG